MGQNNTRWPDEYVVVLERMWEAGAQTAEISKALKKMGAPYSAAAVCGKIGRLRDTGRDAFKKRQRKPKVRVKAERRIAIKPPPAPVVPLEQEPLPVRDEPFVPLAQRRTLLELTPDDCRWPYGDPLAPGFFFCGGPIAYPGASYCLHHMGVSYQQPPPRQDVRPRPR